jgi:hypothetical protein
MLRRLGDWLIDAPLWVWATFFGAVTLLTLILLSSCTNTMLAAEALPVDWWIGFENLLLGVGKDVVAVVEWIVDLFL